MANTGIGTSPHAPPLRWSLPPEGALRLLSGKASPAAPIGLNTGIRLPLLRPHCDSNTGAARVQAAALPLGQFRPRIWLCQSAGGATPSGGRELHAASDSGGNPIPSPAGGRQGWGPPRIRF